MNILKVYPNSLAEEIGLSPGDKLLKIDNKRVIDQIDYRFRITDENVLLDLEVNGEMCQVEVEKSYDEDLGVEFEDFKIRNCANDCVFCFAHQNPDNLRQGLYFKDGDYRLSYLQGHYVTMTNMGQNDLNRIVEQKLSPLYISVHATEPELRKTLLLHNKDDKFLEKIQFLSENNIEMHTQIVLIPNVNDGKHLVRTINDLYSLYPMVNSLSIVPVGLTKYRQGLMKLESVDANYAKLMIELFHKLQEKYPGTENKPFMLLSDEWYILAQESLPEIEWYGGLDLIENGVGQVRHFLNDIERDLEKYPTQIPESKKITLVTGTLVHPIFEEQVKPLLNKVENLTVDCIAIKNIFFGESVTVSGLLTGQDIVEQLKGKELGDAVWLSSRIFNDAGDMTLDNMTLEQMTHQLQTPINVTDDSILEIFERNIIG
jgi:putative radical SAM enzyme (TIGR03279 family)